MASLTQLLLYGLRHSWFVLLTVAVLIGLALASTSTSATLFGGAPAQTANYYIYISTIIR